MPSPLAVVRSALVAVLLFAAVVATGYALYAFWPAGVALGLAVGVGAVLAIGARMQLADRAQPADADLAAQLGIDLFEAPTVRTPERKAAKAAKPATTAKPVEVAQPEQVAEPERARKPERAPKPEKIRRAPRFTALVAPRPAVQPAPAADLEPVPTADALLDAAPVLHAQPDVLYFTSEDDPDATEARVVVADPVRSDLEHLKADLGDDYRDFARAARLVVSTQYASAARLQRELDLPYSRARRLLADLEQQHFVGPATGSLPRQVLMPKDRLPEVERLLTEA